MRMILRRRFVLPVLLAAVAAIVGGLFAGLGGPDPTRDTSAGHTGQPIYFRFLPPSKADDADVRLNCGWHKACASEFPDLYPDDTDDDSPLDLGLDFEGGRGDPLYLRGHGHAPGHATQYEPVTVTIYEWPHPVTGKNDTDTPGCLVVEADFKLNSIVNQPSIGRYRLLHAVAASMTSGGTTHGHTYKPHFDSDGAYNQDRIATVAPSTDDPCLGHKDKLDHVHVERDRGLRDALATAAWKENRSRYATERQTEVWDKEPHTRHLAEWAYANNTDSLNWTHQLCIAGSCPIPSLYPTPMLVPAGHDSEESVDGKGGSDDSQADACAEAKKDARSKLPRGTTGITYTPEDCNTLSTTTTGDVEATGTGTGSTRDSAISSAKRNALSKLPSGATNVSYGTPTVTGGQRVQKVIRIIVEGSASTRAGARQQALINWRNVADNTPNLVSLGTRGVTRVNQTSSEQWKATASGTVTQYRLVNGEKENYQSTITVTATEPTKRQARQQALINWRNVADNVPNFVSLGSRGITSVRQISSEEWQAEVSGTVTANRISPYRATVEATAKHTITTYKATVTARGTPPNRAPTASVSASPTTVVGGGAVTLDGTARDRDGDSLTYRWSSSGGGTFTSATALDTTWTAPAVTSTRTVTLTLTVRDSEGSSDTARVTITVIEASPPPAPATPTLGNPSARSLTASWTAVTVSGPAITGYDVRHIATSADETVDANWTVVDSATTGTATSYIIAGLSPTTSYDVQVRGVIGSVKGAWSSSATASTIANQPPTASASASPTRVEGGASVTLDGTAGDPDVGDTLTYEWTSDGGGSFADAAALDTTWTAPGATASDRTVTLTLTTTDEDGLAATATVDVTVAAASASSCVTDLGALTSVVTRNGSWASGCPSTNRVRAQARFYSFTLAQEKEVTIDLVSTDSPPENPYLYLLRGPTRSGRIVDRNNDIGGYPHYDSNSRIARTLSAGTYTVEATTYLGDKVGNFTVTITPAGDTAPAAPAAPSIGTATATTLPLSWSAPASDGGSAITGYDLQYRTGSGSWVEVDAGLVTSHTLTSLASGTSYDVQVRARNAIGDGAWSASVTGTTTAAPVNRAPTASASASPTTVAGGGAVTLDGTASDPDAGDSLTYTWSSSGGGTFADASALDTTWTAPVATTSEQTVTLTLTARDGGGLTDTATVTVTVSAAPTPTPTPTPAPTPAPLDPVATRYDADGDGRISFTEYLEALRDYGAGRITYAEVLKVAQAWQAG